MTFEVSTDTGNQQYWNEIGEINLLLIKYAAREFRGARPALIKLRYRSHKPVVGQTGRVTGVARHVSGCLTSP